MFAVQTTFLDASPESQMDLFTFLYINIKLSLNI